MLEGLSAQATAVEALAAAAKRWIKDSRHNAINFPSLISMGR
jgi:hypothetical protein